MKESILAFSDSEMIHISNRFKILSEPSRLKILRALVGGEKNVTQIITETGLMQANVSKQLKILEKNNIVKCRPSGLQRYYSISDFTVLQICNILCKNI